MEFKRISSKIKLMLKSFFNLKSHSSLTASDIELIKNTQLFTNMDKKQFDHMIHSVKIQNYQGEKLIFHEGEQGNALYVIAEGSVRVFTHDINGIKVSLARLNKGDYFGEQALIGEAYKTRSANIETITKTKLFQIDEKFFIDLLKVDTSLKDKIKKSGYEEFLKILSVATAAYSDIRPIISQIEYPIIKEFIAGQRIFTAGDKPDNVYIILEGKVKLLIPNKDSEDLTSLLLYRGQIFGELGILKNKQRSGSAIADSNATLLSISGDQFKNYVDKFPELKKLLSTLKQIYLIPMKGAVEQYTGNINGGNTITNIYRLDDGRSLISSKFINEDVFTITTVDVVGDRKYKYRKGANKIELDLDNHHIVGIKTFGYWDNLPKLCHLIFSNAEISDKQLEQFELIGEFSFPEKKSEIVCECLSIKRQEIQQLINQGVKDFATLQQLTGVASACEGCKYEILEMLGETPWLSAVMSEAKVHNGNIKSYYLKPINSFFKPVKPGQHIIIQVKMGNIWIERPYSVSGFDENYLRITIKKEPDGIFGQWLFSHASKQLHVNTSQPRGNFIINTQDQSEIICLAGGIGVTPFVTLLNFLYNTHNKKRVHLVYCALTSNDFLFTEEFAKITEEMPSITICYRATDQAGLITEEEIQNFVKSLNNPDIYICAPPGLENLIYKSLQKINYDSKKIHREKFVRAGISSIPFNPLSA